MNTQTFSRSFLQSIPEQRKKQHIDRFILSFITQLENTAAVGKTSFLINPDSITNSSISQHPPAPVITNDDLISALQLKFPDCGISYQEIWIDTHPNTRILKKGILIDWS
jgi:hypothetical protein